MHDIVGHLLSVFAGFFAVMNPVANTPIFLSLTEGDPRDVQKKVARKAMVATFLLIVVFVALGKVIFDLFGVTLPAFRITGGVLIALIGYQMLHGESSTVHRQTPAEAGSNLDQSLSVAITPLAIPILAGPGTIATAMNFASTGGIREMVITLAAFAVLCVVTYFFFLSGGRMVAFLGKNGMNVITRIMGLILATIGVQMLIEGVTGAIRAAS
jgi:multiple antibiotic resistance protein